MTSLAPAPKQPTEVRQASLIAAALALAAERAPADVTTAQLAQAIGVTQGAVFRHFESKEAIWLAVLDATSARLLANLQAAAARHEDNPLSALQAVFEAHVAFVVAHPGMPRLMFQELQHPHESPLKARVGQLMFIPTVVAGVAEARKHRPGPARWKTRSAKAAMVLFVGSVRDWSSRVCWPASWRPCPSEYRLCLIPHRNHCTAPHCLPSCGQAASPPSEQPAMNASGPTTRRLLLGTLLIALLAALAWVALRTGPLAPVKVEITQVKSGRVSPRCLGSDRSRRNATGSSPVPITPEARVVGRHGRG
ncbi:MAG: TetR/AcrR family transcriptional regulator [Burkholderiaceae bacterium]